MPRTIPATLLAHKAKSSTTLCNLMKIKSKNGDVVGMTTLNQDVVYDDLSGDGPVTYHAAVGTQPSSIYSSADMNVDNTEFQSLVPMFDFELNEFAINAGEFDYADFWFYEINYADLSMGHWVVMSGTLGEVRTVDGITVWGEMRSLTDQLKKPVCDLYSLGCRAKFGSTSADERQPCGFDTTALWTNGTVTTVGAESNRTFTDTARTEADGYYEPGLLQWLTGANAGRYVEIETSLSTGQISLAFPTPYNIQAGDTYRIRRDCNKRARDTAKGCKYWFSDQWIFHFRGEPDIPVGDAGTTGTPGASVGPGSGGSTSSTSTEAE